MHKTAGLRDPAAAFPLPATRDDVKERRDANRAVAVSAIGLAWVDPGLTVSEADALGRQVALAVVRQVPDMGSFTWTARATPT